MDKEKFISHANASNQYKIVHATANNDTSGSFYPTIPEWVYNISVSSLVITTSFHGMIFCILNNTNFIILPNTGKAEGMNERIESMLSVVKLEDHLMESFEVQKFEKILNKDINWTVINQKLDKWREESYEFLKQNLS